MPAPDTAVRVRLKYPDVDTFIERFAPNVTRGGLFLASRDPRPVGSVLRFEVLLMSGTPVLTGEGRVTWVREYNPAEPQRPHGMGVQFLYVDPDTRPTLERLLREREARRQPASPGQPPASASARVTATPPAMDRFEDLDGAADETAVKRALDRARLLSSRIDDLEALLAPDTDEAPSVAQALSDMPRLLSGGRRPTGAVRVLDADAEVARRAEASRRDDAEETRTTERGSEAGRAADAVIVAEPPIA